MTTLRHRVGNLTLANQLTFLRLLAVPFFILAILNARFDLALWLFGGAGLTDLLDGLIARVFRQRTPLGAYLDPAADKLLLTAAFVLLTDYPSMFQDIPMANRIPIWLTTLTISRDVFIVAVSLMLYLAYGVSKFRPTLLGKTTTVAEILTIGLFLLFNHLGHEHWILQAACWTTLTLTLLSGFDYLGRTVGMVRAKGPE
jgi:cardiolipin synthase (CMP-forming)